MECTQKQYEKDLKQPLLDLGYREVCFTNWQDSNILTNTLNNQLGFISNIGRMSKEKKDRYFIDHYNPELFLALAAMTEGDTGIKNEWWISDKELTPQLYINFETNSCWRKATKEELITQFSKSKKEEFVLPEMWCLKITKDNREFCRSLKNNELGFQKNYTYHLGGYYSSISKEGCNGFANIPTGYSEITFEQFKKYVLKEKTMEKKLIGYKVPYNLSSIGIKKGHLWSLEKSDKDKSLWSIPFEIVETWEPVYEEEKKEKEFLLRCNSTSSFTLLVTKDGFYYRPDNKILDPVIIQHMILNVSQQYNGYKFTSFISHLDMGCKKMVPVEDIKPLIKYWEELNK